MNFLCADATRLPFADDSFDLVFGSPPYANARTYGIGAQRGCQEWIEFMLRVTAEAVRVSKGLVIWICAGVTRDWCYWPGPEGLLYEWWKQGGRCWRPAYWHRVGIPGSGGKQWLRADVEYALCFTSCRKSIPWADNTANGHPPKWAPGGEMSYRTADGERVNGWDAMFQGGNGERGQGRKANGEKCPKERLKPREPGPNRRAIGQKKITRRISQGHGPDGDTRQDDVYLPPVLANPGCLIKGIKVGGGLMGHAAAHENEAPFPQKLAEWFIRSWCQPGGMVLDPFSGSGTTVAAAATLGRRGVGCDLRLSQSQLGHKRCRDVQPTLLTEETERQLEAEEEKRCKS